MGKYNRIFLIPQHSSSASSAPAGLFLLPTRVCLLWPGNPLPPLPISNLPFLLFQALLPLNCISSLFSEPFLFLVINSCLLSSSAHEVLEESLIERLERAWISGFFFGPSNNPLAGPPGTSVVWRKQMQASGAASHFQPPAPPCTPSTSPAMYCSPCHLVCTKEEGPMEVTQGGSWRAAWGESILGFSCGPEREGADSNWSIHLALWVLCLQKGMQLEFV